MSLTHTRKLLTGTAANYFALMLRLTCPGWIDPLHRHLAPGSRCGSTVYHAVSWPQDAILIIDLLQLEGTPAPEVFGTRRFNIRVFELPLQPAAFCGSFTFRRLHQTQRRVKTPRLKVDAPHSFDCRGSAQLSTSTQTFVVLDEHACVENMACYWSVRDDCASVLKSPLPINSGPTVPLRSYLRFGWCKNKIWFSKENKTNLR